MYFFSGPLFFPRQTVLSTAEHPRRRIVRRGECRSRDTVETLRTPRLQMVTFEREIPPSKGFFPVSLSLSLLVKVYQSCSQGDDLILISTERAEKAVLGF